MIVGILHLHKALAYLVFLVALANVVLALTSGRTDPRAAKALKISHAAGMMGAGRLNLVLGIVLWVLLPYGPGTWWMWVTLLLWGPIEAVGKRLVKAEVQTVVDGGRGSSRLVMGTAVQLVCIVVIFGLMTVRPG